MTGWADIDHNLKEALRLKDAAMKLYTAGRWRCDALPEHLQARLWEDLRDALGLPEGTETSRERREKIRRVLYDHFDNRMGTDAAEKMIIELMEKKP